MKHLITLSLLACGLHAQAQDITLPAPNTERSSLNVVEALATRHSVREYSDKALTEQEISDLCWAACGVSRDNDHRTAPTAMNKKEIRLFVFTAEGVYEYLPVENLLQQKAQGDHRKLVAGAQDFAATAPVCLVEVIDFDRFGGKSEHAQMMACVDAGNVSENINLYCQAVGLCTVPRATMDVAGIKSLLGLGDSHLPIMNNPVGRPASTAKVEKVYDESIDPMTQIDKALARATATGKHVICQVGGNWCKWCLRFADFAKNDADVAKAIADNYIFIHVNYSNESPAPLKERLGNAGRFGYPCFVVLDAKGHILHHQDSSLLENGEGYSKKKTLRFLSKWTPEAVK